jgi:hypothetical protein
MPKEIINSRYHGQELPGLNGAPVEVEATFAHIGWTKDLDHVEIAVLNGAVDTEDPNDSRRGWFMQLDRSGINRMIRALRSARDQAFGRDE